MPLDAKDSEEELVTLPLHWGIFVAPVTAIVGMALLLLLAVLLHGLLLREITRPLEALMPANDPPPMLPLYSVMLLPVLAAAVLMGVPCLGLLWLAWDAYAHTTYSLTTKRLRFRCGWFCRTSGELPLQKVESVFVEEPLLGRMLGYGTLKVIGTGGTEFRLHFLPGPQYFHERLQEALEAVRSGRPVGPDSSFHKAWEELNRPPPDVEDDSRYMPKG